MNTDNGDHFGEPWCCPGCRAFIGFLCPDGTLSIGAIRTAKADLECVNCGKITYWRRSDARLKRLIERVRQRHILTTVV